MSRIPGAASSPLSASVFLSNDDCKDYQGDQKPIPIVPRDTKGERVAMHRRKSPIGTLAFSKIFLELIKNLPNEGSAAEYYEKRADLILKGFFNNALGEQFTEFTQGALCSENMEFLKAVHTYREKYESLDDTENRQAAAAILRVFVNSKAPKQINIDHKQRIHLALEVIGSRYSPEPISKNLFNQTVSEIFDLLGIGGGPFQRFVSTQE